MWTASGKVRLKLLAAASLFAVVSTYSAHAQEPDTGGIALGSDFATAQAKLVQEGFTVHEFKFNDPSSQLLAALKGPMDKNNRYSETYSVNAVNGKIVLINHEVVFATDKPVAYSNLAAQLAQKYGPPSSSSGSNGSGGSSWIIGKAAAIPAIQASGACAKLQLQVATDQAPGPDGKTENFNGFFPRGASSDCPVYISVAPIGYFEPGKGSMSPDLAGGVRVELYDGKSYYAYLKQKNKAASAAAQQRLNQAGGNRANGL